MSSRHYGHNRNRRRIRHKLQHSHYKSNSSLHSSVSSLTDSTMSLNIITVTLNMDSVNFLGISIVGQSNKGGEGGIYVGSIMSGGAVALDGRIEPGDMILQVNDVSFENMSNDDAVRVLREAVMKPGPVKLVVAKCWDPNPQGYFTVSKQEPVRPIDPSAWVAHTQAHTGIYPIGSAANGNMYNRPSQFNPNQNMNKLQHHRLTHSVSTFGSSSSLSSSLADTTISTTYNNGVVNNYKNYNYGNNLGTTTTTNADSTRFGNEHLNLTIKTDMETLVRAMAAPDSGLEVRDRNWLKITIQNAFIGSEVVDWLFNHVEGFPDRRDARKYACDMLKYGFIRHAVNKVRFSEQCYYVFGDFNQSTLNSQMMTMNGGGGGNLFTLNEENELDFDSVSELDRDAVYAPMNFPPPPPGSFNNYQHHPRLYSNLNGIGGPPPPPSYLSSSSSNATSNSTSTTSNNTTTQTIATTTTAMGFNAGSSSSGVGGSSMTSSNSNTTANTTNTQSSFGGGVMNGDRQTACQFYYPPPSLQMTSFSNNNTISSFSSSLFHNNKPSNTLMSNQSDSQNESVNQTTQQSQYTIDKTDFSQSQFGNGYNYTTQLTTPYYQGGNRFENRSIRSSDNSSSGNGSDVELLSSSKTKRKQMKENTVVNVKQTTYYNQQVQSTNYYEIGPFDPAKSNNSAIETGSLNSSTGSAKQRSLDKVPSEMRSSKTSFHNAMGNPCEFFVDVM